MSVGKQGNNLRFFGSIFLAWMSVQVYTLPLQADDLVNVTDYRDCLAIEASAERLFCFETIAKGGVFNEQKLKQLQMEEFGSNKKEASISADQLLVTIVKVDKTQNGQRYFHTEGGKVWKQLSSDRWSTQAPFEAEIKSGAFGSFYLVEAGRNHSIRVKRIK